MAITQVLDNVDILGPPPPQLNLEADFHKAGAEQLPSAFDPVALKQKYLEERDRRLQNNGGTNQYRIVDDGGMFAHFLNDPWVKPGFTREPVSETVDVVIIGGGYGAQLVAVRLIEAGVKNIRIIEKAGDFGGTWYWNRYPGAQCDIESYVYMPLLEELGYMPTEKYARAKELLEHAAMIGKKWDLYARALFQTEVRELRWNEDTGLWTVSTSRNDKVSARFVIPAAGPLHRPKLPGVPGIEDFQGHSFHSGRWDYSYTGGDNGGGLHKLGDKRVAVIGTGATAVQIVPNVAKYAKELYVFQRTPSSIGVRANRPTDLEWAASLKPGWQQERMDNFELIVNGGIAEQDLVQDGWTDILHKLLSRMASPEAKSNPAAAAAARQMADFENMESIRARCDQIVKDKATAESLKPWYNQFCKRPCFHDEYLQAFNQPNVHLVDTKGRSIERITATSVIANNGKEYPVDCIIYATGFELATDWSHRTNIQIYGRHNQSITEKWENGASTLHGWTSRNFPNCFFVSIVQAGLTPNFIHVTSEQARHLAYIVSECSKRNIRTLEPTQEAEEKWVKTILELGAIRGAFFKECTPGYYNNEGSSSKRAGKNASYGGGSSAFIKILQDWRAKGDLEGLDVRHFE